MIIHLLKRKNKNDSNIVLKPQYLQTFCFPYNSTTFSKPFTSLKYFYMADIWLDVNWRIIIRTFFGLDTIPKLQCKFRQPEMRKKKLKKLFGLKTTCYKTCIFSLFKIYSGLSILKFECETTFSIVISSVHCSRTLDNRISA